MNCGDNVTSFLALSMADRNDFSYVSSIFENFGATILSIKIWKKIVRNIMHWLYVHYELVRRHNFFRHFFIHSYKLYIRFEEEKLTKRMLLIEFSIQTFTPSTQLEMHYGIVLIGQWAFRQSLMKNHIFTRKNLFLVLRSHFQFDIFLGHRFFLF